MTMKPAIIPQKHDLDRVVVFGTVVIATILVLGIIDHIRGLKLSAIILYFFAGAIALIVLYRKLGYSRFLNTTVVLVINFFVTLTSMAEGLKTGGYLFILPAIFGLVFMLGNTREYQVEVITYFAISIFAFAFAILCIPEKSSWQVISEDIYQQMFITNTLTVVILCALFAYFGIHFEREIYAKLVNEKNKAEQHEKMILEQNKQLKDIAFISSHTLRAPLTNILGLTALINQNAHDIETNTIVIAGIASSAKELDEAIHNMVSKTGSLIQQDQPFTYLQQDLQKDILD
jgi:signal transduction histidine kinase